MMSPTTSVIEVISGLLATAGSKPRRVKINGRAAPIIFATRTMENMVNAIIMEMVKPPTKKPRNQLIMPIVAPRVIPMRSSLARALSHSVSSTSPTAMALTINVDDWAPVLPPLAMSNGRKQ